MRWKVLISAPYFIPVWKNYQGFFLENQIEVVVPKVEERLSEDELLKYIGDIDGIISGDDQFTEKVLRAAPKLKVISKWGTGIDSIDQKVAKALGIAVKNTPDAFTLPVADSVMGYILCFARKLHWMDQSMKAGRWEKQSGTSLSECTLGIIGVGNIGRAVTKRALAFGMRVIGNDIQELPKAFLESTGMKIKSKEDLLKVSDFVSLNCDLNPTSFHILDEQGFELMKPTAYLINMARGPLIDEPALIQALEEGRIAGAALDVFEKEPLPKESPLRSYNTVLLAPHNSNSSPLAWERVHAHTLRNLLEELKRD